MARQRRDDLHGPGCGGSAHDDGAAPARSRAEHFGAAPSATFRRSH